VDEWSDGEDPEQTEDIDERKPLEGMRLTSTGKLESANREEVRRMCSTLGATFEPVLAADATFLLADRTMGDKYRVSELSEGRRSERRSRSTAPEVQARMQRVARGREPEREKGERPEVASQVCIR
jgi:glutathione S-transferase